MMLARQATALGQAKKSEESAARLLAEARDKLAMLEKE